MLETTSIELIQKEIKLLLALINMTTFQGKDLESVLDLKQKLSNAIVIEQTPEVSQ